MKSFIKKWSQKDNYVIMYGVDGDEFVIHSSLVPYGIVKDNETDANYSFSYQVGRFTNGPVD